METVVPNEVVLEESSEQKEVQSEFEYLTRNEFTSEIYKIEVRNLGYFGIGEFKKLLKNKLQLDMSKIKSPLRKDFAFVCFRSLEDQEKAISLLNGYKWKGKVLQAQVAKASADPLQRKRKEGETLKDGEPNKRYRTSAEATCPLSTLAYEDQLKQKDSNMRELAEKFVKELKKTNKEAKVYMENFKYEGVLPSPQVDGYRNKNEFTVGKNAEGEIVVGFRLGSYADGSVEVADVQSLPHIPKEAKWGATSFQNFVRKSRFQPFNPEANAGHFRQLMVRTSSQCNQIMLVVGIYSSNLSADDLEELKRDLKQFYDNSDDTEFKCTSLYYQDVKHREAGQMVYPVEHLGGATHITDTIHGLSFRISPLAFFQINTAGANVLYQKAIELASPQPHSTILDICCGTGTIALSFAKHCKQVLGVDIIPDAIKDAEYNAENNNIKNSKFFAGDANYHYIQSMVREVTYGTPPGEPLDLIAIVDPPRAGLHNRSIAAIRAAPAIKRLVYISCNPQRAQRNWIELGRPESKQYKGEPFFPKTAVAVDMFPHTTHTEMVILFERRVCDRKQSEDNETESETPVELSQTPDDNSDQTTDKLVESNEVIP